MYITDYSSFTIKISVKENSCQIHVYYILRILELQNLSANFFIEHIRKMHLYIKTCVTQYGSYLISKYYNIR